MKSIDDRIKNRNSWFKILIISLFTMVLMFKVATAKFSFNFSDLLSFILGIFAIAISVLFYTKVNEIVATLGELTPSLRKKKKVASLPSVDREEAHKTLREHQEQLQHIKQVQAEVKEKLVSAREWEQDDQRNYIDYLLQKEKEATVLEQKMNELRHLLGETGEFPLSSGQERITSLNELANVLGKDVILSATFDELSEHVKIISSSISPTLQEGMIDSGYIDADFQMTRKGLKELRSTAKKLKR
ncbi:hypothetical protein A374_02734 [Fictibacillus macauensis ZFHKF-1]|uniref:Uncharacterized protein n=1 Tax=Fictibacillus macauensis ZFHKF-1 TaxID=1196324 RepID=I8AN30_9BACL|nr:hypothetical protein [Fictibacillus macauensis]EIT87134.1 hypothetical protein A374_02734 [Fictibacillus macauensis ZFHKF-1]